jgi:hypothetical protein
MGSTISVDQLTEMEGLAFPNHLKIDVDGLEGIIIENMTKTLADKRVKSVIIEVATNLSKGSIEKQIKQFGFELVYEKIVSADGLVKNFFFERKNTI